MYKQLLINFRSKLTQANSLVDLNNLEKEYFGDQGHIKQALAGLKEMSPEQKRTLGPEIQALKAEAISLLETKKTELSKIADTEALKKESEDLSPLDPKIGHLHPLTETVKMMNRFFASMGYSVMDGPEIETDEYCFQRLNVPKDHPARDMQDTIYISQPNILLRTQTSSIESRVLSTQKPPFKVVCPGRVYRNEKPNKSNHFIFHHYQGVVVMPHVTLQDLFGTLRLLFQQLYGPDVIIRFRNKYYPEVEPGVGPDMQCFNCLGKGCAVCKHVGWIEMGGAGIIHPKVMKQAGLDPEKWRGFAFGLGLDRWVMAKYNITDIRTLLGGNLGYRYHEHESTI